MGEGVAYVTLMERYLLATTICAFALTSSGEILCPPNIKTYSAGANIPTYYSCERAGVAPVKLTCPEDHVYWARKGKCHRITEEKLHPLVNRMNVSSGTRRETEKDTEDILPFSAPTLGRVVYLGDLYSASKDEIMVGESLWQTSNIKDNKMRTYMPSSSVDFFSTNTITDRISHLDINAELKLDFLGGLISVGGSAGYLRDSVETENEVSVVMKYKATTHSESLPLTVPQDFSAQVCHRDTIKKKGYTHVVSTIKYGIGANFIFKRKTSKNDNKEEISGSLQVAIKSIPAFQIEGQAEVKIEGETKYAVKSLDVRMYGDFVLENQPGSFEEAVKVYQTLPSHLGVAPKYEKAAKLQIQLTPLSMYCNAGITAILTSISTEAENAVSAMLSDVDKLKIKVNTLFESSAAFSYQAINNIVSKLLDAVIAYEIQTKSEVQNFLPKIRSGGNAGESPLIEMLNKYSQSHLNFEGIRPFLSAREREINMIGKIIDPYTFVGTSIQIKKYHNGNDIKIIYTTKYVVKLEFNILPDEKVVDNYLRGDQWLGEENAWFNDPFTISYMGANFSKFKDFAKVNSKLKDNGYIFSIGNSAGSAAVAVVTAFENGVDEMKSHSFEIPPSPEIPTVSRITHNSISFRINIPSGSPSWKSFVTKVSLKYWQVSFGIEKEKVMKSDVDFGSDTTITLVADKLNPGTPYAASVQYVTNLGASVAAEIIKPEVTRFLSSPEALQKHGVTHQSFGIKWKEPSKWAQGFTLKHFKISIKEMEEQGTGAQPSSKRTDVTEPGSAEAGSVTTGKERSTEFSQTASASGEEAEEAPTIVHGEEALDERETPARSVVEYVVAASSGAGPDTEYTYSYGAALPATGYIIVVIAVAENKLKPGSPERDSTEATLELSTKPNKPSDLKQVIEPNDPLYHTAKVRWTAPQIRYGQLSEYIVKYRTVGADNTEILEERSAMKNTEYTLNGLAMATLYTISVQVRTTGEDSEFSETLEITTDRLENAITLLENDIREDIKTKVVEKVAALRSDVNAKAASVKQRIAEVRRGLIMITESEETIRKKYADFQASDYVTLNGIFNTIKGKINEEERHWNIGISEDDIAEKRENRQSEINKIVGSGIDQKVTSLQDKLTKGIPRFFSVGLGSAVSEHAPRTDGLKECLQGCKGKSAIYNAPAKECACGDNIHTDNHLDYAFYETYTNIPVSQGKVTFHGDTDGGIWGSDQFCQNYKKVIGFRKKKGLHPVYDPDTKLETTNVELLTGIELICEGDDRTGRGRDWVEDICPHSQPAVSLDVTIKHGVYISLGCWKDKPLNFAISNAEWSESFQDCSDKAEGRNYRYFALQNFGISCFHSKDAGDTYTRYGSSNGCHEGGGGIFANNVYHIVRGVSDISNVCRIQENNICEENEYFCGIQYNTRKTQARTEDVINYIYGIALKCCRSPVVVR